MSVGTASVPPPMPIVADRPPIDAAIAFWPQRPGSPSRKIFPPGKATIWAATISATTPNTPASKRPSTDAAKSVPSAAPIIPGTIQRLSIASSSEPLARCARADSTDVGTIVASDVATAICIRIASSMPASPRTQ